MDEEQKQLEKEESGVLRKLRQRKKLVGFVLILIIAGAVIWRLAASRRAGKEEKTEVRKGEVIEELVLSGEIKADEYAQLYFPASGRISWVKVSEGDLVRKGQWLAQIDTTKINADFQRARSDLRDANATLDRVHDDLKDHASDETWTQKETRTAAEVARDKAWENYVKAEEDLKNAILKAPFAGIVTYIAHSFAGENILYTEKQIEIVNPETIYFEVGADQSEVIDLASDQEISVVLDSYSDEEFKAKVDFIGYTPISGEIGTVYKVKVKFIDTEIDLQKFRIGMTGDAKFILSKKQDVLYVPPKYVKSDTQGKYVRLNRTNNKVYIEVGIEGEERVEINGEISEGDVVYD